MAESVRIPVGKLRSHHLDRPILIELPGWDCLGGRLVGVRHLVSDGAGEIELTVAWASKQCISVTLDWTTLVRLSAPTERS